MDRVIGLIGAGAIGGTVLRAYAERTIECRRVVVFVRHRRPELEEQVRRIGGTVVGDLESFVIERRALSWRRRGTSLSARTLRASPRPALI